MMSSLQEKSEPKCLAVQRGAGSKTVIWDWLTSMMVLYRSLDIRRARDSRLSKLPTSTSSVSICRTQPTTRIHQLPSIPVRGGGSELST